MTDNQLNEYQYNAEQILNAIRNNSKRILAKRLKIEALKASTGASAIRYDKDPIKSSPSNFIERALIDAIDLEKEIEEDLARDDANKLKAYRIINLMDNLDEQNALLFYYIDGYKADECIMKMKVSERAFYNLRNNALISFGELL